MTHIVLGLSLLGNLYLVYKLFIRKEKIKDLNAKYISMVAYIESTISNKKE